jgi:CubicO group peptidase (beta-lactamase class C family)
MSSRKSFTTSVSLLCLLVLSVALKPAAADARPELSERLAAIEKAVEAKRAQYGVPGLSLAIVKDGKVIYMNGFGLRDVEKKLPVTPDTLFAIGSSSKAFTAMLVQMAADEGKLSLDDAPSKHLAYFKLQDPEANEQVTIRDLLCHRTGLGVMNLAWVIGGLNRDEVIQALGNAKPTAPFRKKFQYQNVMFSAAGQLVANVENSTWEQLVKERIFKPLGMKGSDISVKEMLRAKDFSLGYTFPISSPIKPVSMRDLPAIAPAGAINSNARDLVKWLQFMMNGGTVEGKRLVSEGAYKELITPQMAVTPTDNNYGLGWFLKDWKGHRIVHHGGNIDGFNAMVSWVPDQNVGFVTLTNVGASPLIGSPVQVGDIMNAVYSNLIDDLPSDKPAGPAATDPTANTTPVDAATGAEVAGSYSDDKDQKTLEIVVRDGKLTLNSPTLGPRVIVQKEKDHLSLADIDVIQFTLHRDATGKVNGLRLSQPTGEFEFVRAQPFVAPLSTDELIAKMVDALGGETALRSHKTMIIKSSVNYENEGISGESVVTSRAPFAQTVEVTFIGAGKKMGTERQYFDGTAGGEETSFTESSKMSPAAVKRARQDAAFYGPLEWKSLYKKLEIKRLAKVGEEEAYVLVLTPEAGQPTTQFVSTKTFLVLRRDSPGSPGQPAGSTTFSDYREVGGIKVPFRSIDTDPTSGTIVSKITSVKLDVPVKEAVFQARTPDKRVVENP